LGRHNRYSTQSEYFTSRCNDGSGAVALAPLFQPLSFSCRCKAIFMRLLLAANAASSTIRHGRSQESGVPKNEKNKEYL
jgi:hypothetical protein